MNSTDSKDTNCVYTNNISEHAAPYAKTPKLSQNGKLNYNSQSFFGRITKSENEVANHALGKFIFGCNIPSVL